MERGKKSENMEWYGMEIKGKGPGSTFEGGGSDMEVNYGVRVIRAEPGKGGKG